MIWPHQASSKCLLATPDNFEELTLQNNGEGYFGSYLVWDARQKVWRRTGKACGEGGFNKRIFKQHFDSMKDATDSSLFYDYWRKNPEAIKWYKSWSFTQEKMQINVGVGFKVAI